MAREHSHDPATRALARFGLPAAALLVALPAWALHWPSVHWPWQHRAPPPAPPVQVLTVEVQGADGAAPTTAASSQTIQQYWDRNTLLLDLTRVSTGGSAQLTPLAGNGWPVRLEFRVRPGSIGRLEVLAAQRLIFTVPGQGAPVVLRLDPGVYQPDTAQISLRWSAADGSAR